MVALVPGTFVRPVSVVAAVVQADSVPDIVAAAAVLIDVLAVAVLAAVAAVVVRVAAVVVLVLGVNK